MDPRHNLFARSDPMFYDHPSRRHSRRSRPLLTTLQGDRGDWRHVDDGSWSFWFPAGATLPDRGWKIHISATPETAVDVVTIVASYCHANQLAFKHLPDLAAVAAQLGKDADRSAAGKIVTIYSADEATLHRTLLELDARIGGMPSPRVLSDLRWRDGPLSVRYGAFTLAWLRDEHGRKLHGLRHPDGDLVEDRRTAAFTPPPWVELPPFLQEEWERLGDGSKPDAFAYDVVRPLAYSNAGGTYLARDRDAELVVLKEARPHAGFTPDGRDAVARLRDEHARLLAVAGTGIVGVRELFEAEEHLFLALEYVDGIPLTTALVSKNPTIRAGASAEDYLAYRQWALHVGEQVHVTLSRIHAAGFTHGDLHPGNIMITPGDRVVLIDLELSTPLDDYAPAEVGAPGFVPFDGRGGADADLYALACVQLSLFSPLTSLIYLDAAKLDDLLAHARDFYALPESWVSDVGDVLRPRTVGTQSTSRLAEHADAAIRTWDVGDEPAVSELMVLIGRSIAASADLSRSDRLWPGDPAQFSESAVALAHGAGGVIHALRSADLDVDPLALAWFRHATDAALADPDVDLGLYDGLAGAGWVHRRVGDDARADAILARLRNANPERLGPDLYGGLPGIGLLFLSELEREPTLLDDLVGLASDLRRRHDERRAPDADGAASRVRGTGLMWGATGTALFALRLYEQTGDAAHLKLAADAVDHDLRYCLAGDDGSLHVNEGYRLMPYLASGSAGIGLVLAQLIGHLDDSDRSREALAAIMRAASTPFTIEAGLFDGRAGLILFHVALARLGLSTPETRAAMDEHAAALRLHALRHGTGIGFPGAGLLRLSSDLATGSSGVLLALESYGLLTHDPERAADFPLPFFLPTATAAASLMHRPMPAGWRR